MKMKKFFTAAAVFCISAGVISSCKSAQIGFPEGSDKSTFDQYEVRDRRAFALFSGKFTVGPYTVDWTRGAVVGMPSEHRITSDDEDVSSVREKYTVAVKGADGAIWNGECRSEAEFIKETEKTRKITTTTTQIISNTLSCTLKSSDKQTIEFKIIQESQGMSLFTKKSGTFKWRNSSFRIESTNRLDGSSWGLDRSSGFYIMESDAIVAVVDVLNEGRVYIVKGLGKDKTFVMAAVSAVLLGYKDPMESDGL